MEQIIQQISFGRFTANIVEVTSQSGVTYSVVLHRADAEAERPTILLACGLADLNDLVAALNLAAVSIDILFEIGGADIHPTAAQLAA